MTPHNDPRGCVTVDDHRRGAGYFAGRYLHPDLLLGALFGIGDGALFAEAASTAQAAGAPCQS